MELTKLIKVYAESWKPVKLNGSKPITFPKMWDNESLADYLNKGSNKEIKKAVLASMYGISYSDLSKSYSSKINMPIEKIYLPK